MSIDVILIDNHDDVMRVHCQDEAEAERVGAAAIWSDGGVSAWRVPSDAVNASEDLIAALRAGEDLDGVRTILEGGS